MTRPDPPAPAAQADTSSSDETFDSFFARVERPLAVALAARFGDESGREAAVDALSWAWEHWDRLAAMENPAGYLYRVGQTRARRQRRLHVVRTHRETDTPSVDEVEVEPALAAALDDLSTRQRQVVVLAHGYACTHREIAELLGLSRSSVQNHAERGLTKLRRRLEIDDD